MENIGEKVFKYRGRHGLSQEKFADLAGVALQTINKVENKNIKLQATTQAKIEKILALETQELSNKENLTA